MKVSKDILVKAEKNEAVESFLEDISMTLSGSARSKAFMNSSCVTCPGSATKFKDAVSEKEYTISGMCQLCQDQIWDTDVDPDWDGYRPRRTSPTSRRSWSIWRKSSQD